jgi:uncharacterized protein YukE
MLGMDKIELEAQLNAVDETQDWQSAVRTLRRIIERLNDEIEQLKVAKDGEA